jgi:predicted ArsR family transcriptional regulator
MSQMTREDDGRAGSGRRRAVLGVLKDTAAALSISEIAEQVGVHPNTVRFHLDTLIENGQVERVETDRHAPGRPPLFCRAVRGMDPTGPRGYRLLAEVLVHSMATGTHPRAKAVAASRAWGRAQGTSRDGEGGDPDDRGDSVDRLVELLDEIGFAPEARMAAGQRQIGLRHCPFLELAGTRSEIVCPVHLGLMQGAMEAWHSPVAVDRLEPFVEPNLCLAHLSSVGVP